MRSVLLAMAVGVLSTALAGEANAASISYTQTGVGSGTLNGVGFSNASFTITALGDTAARQDISGGFSIDNNSATISIAGLGTYSFITGTRFFVSNDTQTVGFSRAGVSGLDLYNGPTNVAFATWNMQSSIGPIAGSGALLQWGNGAVQTSGGTLLFNSSSSAVNFTATVGAPVPLPASAGMGLSVLGGLGIFSGVRRRMRRGRAMA